MAYYATYMPNELGELQKVVINAGIGFCLPFYGETAPPGTLACDGSAVSRQAYKELFQVLGTKAGAGDGSTTFNLPDLRGQFVRGTGGNAAELGVEQGDAIRNFSGTVQFRGGNGNVPISTEGVDGIFSVQQISANGERWATQGGPYLSSQLRLDVSRSVPTADENRPRNVALLWCIIYE